MPFPRSTTLVKPAYRFSLLALIAVLILSACQTQQTPPPTQAPPQPPPVTMTLPPQAPTGTPPPPSPTSTLTPAQFIGSSCSFKLPPSLSEGVNLDCGYLVVPADRGDPSSGSLQLAVAILRHPEGSTKTDPILYLEGGPGGSALEFLNLDYDRRYSQIFEAGRDIILFDQRGVGLSRPALDCPEQDDLFFELLDNEKDGVALSEEEMDQLSLDAMAACADNLASKADLADFNSDASAADVKDLAQALGYSQVNLWGTSYGTRLALEVMRDYPEIVRSAVLDSTFPPQVNLYEQQPANMTRAFELLFDSCADDETCNAAYPDLKTVFYATVDALNAENARFDASDPLTGKTYPTAISGDNFIDLLFQFLYVTDVIPMLPRLIYDVSQGKTDLLALLVGSLIATQSAISDGMHQAVQCAEEIAFNSPEALQAEADKVPELADYFDEGTVNSAFDTCQAMEIAAYPDPTVEQAVTSDIPALVIAGQFDPITPPAWGELAEQDLSKGSFYEYPAAGHAPSLAVPCARQMMIAFLQDPSRAPNDACLQEMPAVTFITPPPTEVTLVPYENDDMKLQGLSPEGWQEVSPGVFSRQHSALDRALVLSQSAALTAQGMLSQISRQVGLSTPPEPAGELQSENLTWTLYNFEARGTQVDMAIAEVDGTAYIVLLQSIADERDNLYEKVFTPMVEALKPL